MSVRFPAEWEPQSGVLLTWPHIHSDWAPLLPVVEPVYVDLAIAIAHFEPTVILCWDQAHRAHITALLDTRSPPWRNIAFHEVHTNDTWIRDYGPITVISDGAPRLLDFTFNSWGNKFAWDKDNQVSRRLHAGGLFGATPLCSIDFVLEGGSIESDGRGTLMTTTRCLLSPQRNPRLNREQIERNLSEALGVERILWLTAGSLVGDDTDSHIDILARYCSPDTIIYTRCDEPRYEQYADLNQMEAELRGLRTGKHAPYQLVPLPWPGVIVDDSGSRLAASYANFLIINHAVLAPVYNAPNDEAALRTLEACFPDRAIIPVHCAPLIHQGGSLHCATMQLPQGVL